MTEFLCPGRIIMNKKNYYEVKVYSDLCKAVRITKNIIEELEKTYKKNINSISVLELRIKNNKIKKGIAEIDSLDDISAL